MPSFPSYISRLFRPKQAEKRASDSHMWSTLSSPSWVTGTGSARSLPGVIACTTVIEETIASLRLEVLKRGDSGDSEQATEHPLYNLLKDKPNSRQTSFVWRETVMDDSLLEGNGYSRIIRKGNEIEQIVHYPYSAVTPKITESGRIVYDVAETAITKKGIYQDRDMLDIPFKATGGISATTPLKLARDSFIAFCQAQEYGANVYKNGARLSGVLEHPGQLGDEAYLRLQESWHKEYHGIDNAGKTAILEEGAVFKPISMSPEDVELLATTKFNIEQIARMFRVPLHLIQNLDRATFNNIEQLSIDFVRYTIAPWIKKWEQELNSKLLTASERAEGYYIRFDLKSLLRGDSESRAEFYTKLYMIGGLNPNEIRGLEGMNSYDGGDEYYKPLNGEHVGGANPELKEDE